MYRHILKTFAAVICISAFVSCEKETINTIETPVNYEFTRDGASTVNYSGQTTRIDMATELMAGLSNSALSKATLLEMFRNETTERGDANPFGNSELNSSSKSIKSKVAASNDFFSSNTAEAAIIKSDFEYWISAQVDEVFPSWESVASVGKSGQIADGSSVRYVSAKGLEYNQAYGKSLIGALMVDQMLNNYLSPAVLDAGNNIIENDAGIVAEGKNYTNMEHKWDEAYGYLFGKAASAADPLADLGSDGFLSKYLSRVDTDADFAGIAQDIFDAFKLGRAAIVAGDYTVRDEQADLLKELVSKVIAIRAVYYLQQGKNAMPASGYNYGTAFHDLSEGFGFVYSLRFLRQPNSAAPYFSSTEVNGFINQMTAGGGFWTITPTTLDDISEAIATKFDFTVAQAGS